MYMRIRYNFLVHFYKDQEKIVFILSNQKIAVSYTPAVDKVLTEIRKNVRLSASYILEQWVSNNVLAFLIHYQVLLNDTNSNAWWEAIWFHSLSSNPNKLDHWLVEKEIEDIYEAYEASKKKNPDNFTEVSAQAQRNINAISEKEWNFYWSSRRTNLARKKIEETYLEQTMLKITKRKSKKKSYGSWWWFYSVDQVVVTRDDNVYIWTWYTWKLYKSSAPWIFQDLSQGVLPDENYAIEWYNAIVCLISDLMHPLKKYGNRWYRFALIESGAIWLLYRQKYAYRWYLELGWYSDIVFIKTLKKHNIIQKKDTIITHCLLLHY